MPNEYTQVVEAGEFEGAEDVYSCNDCGAHADKPENVKHHDTCKPGESKKWEEYYSREENNV